MVLICLLLVGCGVKKPVIDNNQNDNQNDVLKFKEEYEVGNSNGIVMNIKETSKVKYLTVEEVVSFLENKTGVIYFGFSNCPWCRNILPVLLDTVTTINYFNPANFRGSDDENYKKIMTILDPYLESNDGKKTLFVPDVYFVKNGKIVGHQLGSVASQKDPYVKLNDKQVMELSDIYNKLNNMIK